MLLCVCCQKDLLRYSPTRRCRLRNSLRSSRREWSTRGWHSARARHAQCRSQRHLFSNTRGRRRLVVVVRLIPRRACRASLCNCGGSCSWRSAGSFFNYFSFLVIIDFNFFRVVTKKHSARARPVKSQNTLSHTERLFFISLSRKPLPTTQPRTPPNYSFPQFSGTYFLTQLPTHLAAERSQIN